MAASGQQPVIHVEETHNHRLQCLEGLNGIAVAHSFSTTAGVSRKSASTEPTPAPLNAAARSPLPIPRKPKPSLLAVATSQRPSPTKIARSTPPANWTIALRTISPRSTASSALANIRPAISISAAASLSIADRRQAPVATAGRPDAERLTDLNMPVLALMLQAKDAHYSNLLPHDP